VDQQKDFYFTTAQLRKLHRAYLHPSVTKLYELLRKSCPEEASLATRRVLEEIQAACEVCQELQGRPVSFSVRTPNEVVFNQELYIDLMYIEKRPVLHVVDAGTRFSSARFLPRSDAQTVWMTFVQMWSLLYIGHPESILTDQGSVFLSREWSGMCAVSGITLRHTGTEAHNALNVGESLHQPLRRIYEKVRAEHGDLLPEYVLALATYTLNAFTNAEGLCPSLLVFGQIPPPPEFCATTSSQQDRARAMQTARAEFQRVLAERSIRRGLQSAVPSKDLDRIRSGTMVYVYREGAKRWTGPYPVVHRHEKDVLVSIHGQPRSFNISTLKPAPVSDPAQVDETTCEIDSSNAKMSSSDSQRPSAESTHTLLTEIVDADDPRASQFTEAKRKEVLGLIERGTFGIQLACDAPPRPNILPSRFVLTVKNVETDRPVFKARLVVGGHRDREKSTLVHDSQTVRASAVRMLLAMAACFDFEIWSTDVNQAYLQAATPLLRDVFIKAPDVLTLNQGELLRLLKPLYGLSEAGDYWSETLRTFHLTAMQMEGMCGDMCMFMKHAGKLLVGCSASYVDDLLQCGTPEFKKQMQHTIKTSFDVKAPQPLPLTFAGLVIESDRSIHQTPHIRRLQKLGHDASYEEFRSARAKIAWVGNTRPDVLCAISRAAQVTASEFSAADVTSLNQTIEYLQRTADWAMKFPPLDIGSLTVVAFADSSFNNLPRSGTQLGFVVLLTDVRNRCHFLTYKSYRARRIVRSSTAGETLALSDAFDAAFTIRHDLQRAMKRDIPMILLTDSDALFKTLTRSRQTVEKRLMVDLAALREAYLGRDLANIGLMPSRENPADGLTKRVGNDALLRILRTGTISFTAVDWVIERDHRSSPHTALRARPVDVKAKASRERIAHSI
jgi:transposase InsO family protein